MADASRCRTSSARAAVPTRLRNEQRLPLWQTTFEGRLR